MFPNILYLQILFPRGVAVIDIISFHFNPEWKYGYNVDIININHFRLIPERYNGSMSDPYRRKNYGFKNWGIINASSYLWNNSYTGGLKVAIE